MSPATSPLDPPAWLEGTLHLLLTPRDRETIPDDLREAWREEKLPSLGRARANLWYARQVASFAPRHLVFTARNTPVLVLLCLLTALCGAWLGAIRLLLGLPIHREGEVIAATIVAQAFLTLLALVFRRASMLRAAALAGCAAITFLAAEALRGTLRGNHFEGYILLIALALSFQAALTVRTLTHTPPTAAQTPTSN